MKLFLWVNIALLALCIVGELSMLARWKMEPRTPSMVALDVLANGALLVWAAVLLVNL
jgi:hypothetical protein